MTENAPTMTPEAVQKMIQDAFSGIGGIVSPPTPQTFEEVLAEVDPRDSDAALEMLDFLLRSGRLQRVGTLDGGQGYMFIYREPKGTTKEGYAPGGTQGDRIVDQAVEQARASDTKPRGKQGLCKHCMSVVVTDPEGKVTLEEPDAGQNAAACAANGGGLHQTA